MARANPRVLDSLLHVAALCAVRPSGRRDLPRGLAGGESTATHPNPFAHEEIP